MEKGKIERLTDRGFGFIKADNEEFSDDLFFHANEVQGADFDELKEGEAIQFEISETPKGLNAVSVRRGSDDDAADAADTPDAPEVDDEDEGDDIEEA